jgi:hypothetical protein
MNENITVFLAISDQKTAAAVALGYPVLRVLSEIETIFERANEPVHTVGPVTSVNLLTRARCSTLAAIRLATAGQTAEVPPLMRLAAEAALYAFAIATDSTLDQYWNRRGESEEARKRMWDRFRPGELRHLLERADSALADRWHLYYDEAIELGAHPNPLGTNPYVSVELDPNGYVKVDMDCLLAGREVVDAGLCWIARGALVVLRIAALTFRERFRLLGLDDAITDLEKQFQAIFAAQARHTANTLREAQRQDGNP